MALPEDPISGGYELSNSAGIDDRWSCPNCYQDHVGSLDGDTVSCGCGATLKLTIRHDPVCVTTCVDPDVEDDD